MKTLQQKWDKKAKKYNRYTDSTKVLEATICNYISQVGIDLTEKTVLDIGCGTGVYTLRIAQKARRVDAIDISPVMLSIANEDAGKIDLHNLHTHQSSWEDFPLDSQPYYIAVATMFPALKEDHHFQKMHDAAHTKLFLGWGGKRGTELIEALFEAHGGTYQPPNSATVLKSWLDKETHSYQVIEHTEKKIRIKPWEEAVENYSWHLKVRGMTPDKEKIMQILQQYKNEKGEVVETTLNYLNLIIW